MAKASDNAFPSLLITEGTEPSAPAAGKQRLYIDSTTHLLMLTNSSGTESAVGSTTAANLQAAKYKRTSGNYTTTSATFVDVDGTNLALTITTGARRCMVGVVGTVSNSGTNTNMFDIAIDGTRQGGDFGLWQVRTPVAGYRANASFQFLTDALTAASHTFKLQWLCNTGTATLYGTSSGDSTLVMWVQEIYGA